MKKNINTYKTLGMNFMLILIELIMLSRLLFYWVSQCYLAVYIKNFPVHYKRKVYAFFSFFRKFQSGVEF